MKRRRIVSLFVAAILLPVLAVAVAQAHSNGHHRSSTGRRHGASHGRNATTTTPIKHLVVIFQENVSFDHYFATYPQTFPASGDQRFTARRDTSSVNGLNTPLLAPNNPNSAAIDAIFAGPGGTSLTFDLSGLDLESLELILQDLAVLHVDSNGKLTVAAR